MVGQNIQPGGGAAGAVTTAADVKKDSFLRRVVKTREFGVFIALFLTGLFFTIRTDTFLTVENLLNVTRQVAELGIITVAMTILITSQEFDLSVGSMYALTAIIVGLLVKDMQVSIWLAAPVGLLVAVALGAVNGLITVKLEIPSFITTLGTLMVFRGFALVLSNGWPVSGLGDSAFYSIAAGYLFGVIPMPAVWLVVIAIIGWVILQRSSFGFKVYATGGNKEAARLSGIDTDRVKVTGFMLTALAAGISGIISLSYLGSVAPTQGTGMELDAIAASVIGGTALLGGVGTILGAFLGAMIMGVVRNGLVLMGTSAYWQEALIGLIIVVAVIINVQIEKRR